MDNKLFRLKPLKIKLSDLRPDQLFDDPANYSTSRNIQVLRVGNFQHPSMGQVKVTSEMLEHMVANFKARVRGIDIAVDYKHESDDIAAGWINDLFIVNDSELWATVNWTKQGLTKILDREFRYISADFALDYNSNENPEISFGPTLFGAALTNRPVVKRMAPVIELSEDVTTNNQLSEEEEKMKLEEAKAKIEELEKEKETLSTQLSEISEQNKKYEELEKSKEDTLEENKKLKAELDELKAKLAQLSDELKKAKDKAKMSEKNDAFNRLLSEGKVCEAQRESYINDDFVKFTENMQTPNLQPAGNGGENNSSEISATDKIMGLAQDMIKENKNLDLGSAISKVMKDNKELADKYQQENAI